MISVSFISSSREQELEDLKQKIIEEKAGCA